MEIIQNNQILCFCCLTARISISQAKAYNELCPTCFTAWKKSKYCSLSRDDFIVAYDTHKIAITPLKTPAKPFPEVSQREFTRHFISLNITIPPDLKHKIKDFGIRPSHVCRQILAKFMALVELDRKGELFTPDTQTFHMDALPALPTLLDLGILDAYLSQWFPYGKGRPGQREALKRAIFKKIIVFGGGRNHVI